MTNSPVAITERPEIRHLDREELLTRIDSITKELQHLRTLVTRSVLSAPLPFDDQRSQAVQEDMALLNSLEGCLGEGDGEKEYYGLGPKIGGYYETRQGNLPGQSPRHCAAFSISGISIW